MIYRIFLYFFGVFFNIHVFANTDSFESDKSEVKTKEVNSAGQETINNDVFGIKKAIKVLTVEREIHIWERYVQGFRQGHHFSLLAGVSRGKWKVGIFGGIEKEKFDSNGNIFLFKYTYYIPIYAKFGYLLGSSFGYHKESLNDNNDFKAPSSYLLPTIDAGLAYNFSPGIRLTLAATYGLERYEGFKSKQKNNLAESQEDEEISITLNTLSLWGAFDYFYMLNWAVRVEYNQRYLRYKKPGKILDPSVPVNTSIEKNEYSTSLSLIYHLL